MTTPAVRNRSRKPRFVPVDDRRGRGCPARRAGRLGLLLLTLAAAGCSSAPEESSEPLGKNASALCITGFPCTTTLGSCTGTGVCNSSGTCVVSHWCNDNNACTSDTCLYNFFNRSRYCVNTAVSNGTACNDSNACTQSDTCQAGACTGGPPPNCNDGNACTSDGCNPSTGCTHATVSCNDGNACTYDSCSTYYGCQHTSLSCDDDDVCTVDGCNASTGCTYAPISCDDYNACTVDGCSAVVGCTHNSIGCSDGNACTTDGCNPATGCTHAALDCNDNNVCTTDGCNTSSGCVHTAISCDDGIPCTVDSCNASSGCAHAFASTATSCNDGKACTGNDHCDGAGNCIGVVQCNDGNLCTVDGCNPDGTCHHVNNVVCTALDSCHDVGACNPATGACTQPLKPNGTSCSDGNACTVGDACQAGNCVPGTPTECWPADECHAPGTCNPATGVCSQPLNPNGTSCSDGNACTVGDSCQNGACAPGTPHVCVAMDSCHLAGECIPQSTSGPECTNPPKANGTPCDDGSSCTLSDSCQSGQCTGAAVVCAALDACHYAGVCDPATGLCSNPVKSNGLPCDDGNGCTTSDSCQSGSCVAGSPVSCADDGNPCTGEVCEPSTGDCMHPPHPATHGCDDGDGCTSGDHCNGVGVCDPGHGCDDADALNGYELCDSHVSCKPGVMGRPVLPFDEEVIERRLGTGRHPVAVSPQRLAVAFVEKMKDAEAPPRIGVATFDRFGAPMGASRFDASVIDSGPVLAGLPAGGFALAYASLGETGGDGLDIVLRKVSADGVIGAAKVIANAVTSIGQRAPDLVWAGDHLVVGWEDESIAGTRRVCWRELSGELTPLGGAECDGGKAIASSLTLASSGTQVAKAWRSDGASGPSVVVQAPAGSRTFALAEASPSGPPALIAVGAYWLAVYTEGCGVQQAALLDDAAEVVSQVPLGTGTPERYEPSLAVTPAGVYLSWREPAQLEGGVWASSLDEVYLQQHAWESNLLTPGAKHTLPAGTALLQGDQANAAIVAAPITDDGALLAAWEDWNPNVAGHGKHGDVLVSLIATPVVR